MFQNITYHIIFGLPLIAYVGMLALVLMLTTATVGYIIHHDLARIPFVVHMTLAFTTVGVALLHGIFALLAYLP